MRFDIICGPCPFPVKSSAVGRVKFNGALLPLPAPPMRASSRPALILAALVVAFAAQTVQAIDNGLGRLPP